MNMTSRRKAIAALAASGPLSKLGISAAKKAPTAGIYSQLGIRPLINFQGTMTTIGASKMSPEIHAAMAEASRDYVYLEEVKDAVGERIAKLAGTESALVASGAAGAICLGTCACLTGEDNAKVRQLPDLTGMKADVVIQKGHRNGYDHAVRNTGVKIVEVEGASALAAALGPKTAMIYFLGGTSHDWEKDPGVSIEETMRIAKKAGVPVLIDAANMLPPWGNITKLAALGIDLIAVSGGKHIRGPQSSGILAGRKDLIRAAWLNSSPHSDSLGRGMKVNREEMIGLWVALEKYAKTDFDAVDRESARQAAFLIDAFKKIGLNAEKTPFDRTRRVHRVKVTWDETRIKLTVRQVEQQLRDGDPRIVVLRAAGGKGLEFTVFMNDPGDEKFAARRMKEIFGAA